MSSLNRSGRNFPVFKWQEISSLSNQTAVHKSFSCYQSNVSCQSMSDNLENVKWWKVS